MAIELLYDNESNYIDHHEEEILSMAYHEDKYPQLKLLWDTFYDNPINQV